MKIIITESQLNKLNEDITDGSLTLKYPDVGDTKKYFIANEKYFDNMKNLKY
jgi:hypothetical protein